VLFVSSLQLISFGMRESMKRSLVKTEHLHSFSAKGFNVFLVTGFFNFNACAIILISSGFDAEKLVSKDLRAH
jgi:hypothetical protein